MKRNRIVLKGIAVGLFVLSLFSCQESQIGAPLNVESKTVSVYEYLKNNKSYSTLVTALDLTGAATGLSIYGSNTLFAPSNDAFQKYLTRKGISDISKINLAELKQLINYHIYSERYVSTSFPASTTTVAGDFILMDISKGLRQTVLNNSITIDTLDISTSNGVVHVISDVLEPPTKTIYTYLQGNPEYSIMAEAISKTGLDKVLLDKVETDNSTKVPSKKFLTFFVESNTLLKQQGINSFDDLARKYSNSYNTTKSYTSVTDSLNIFVKYHCLNGKYFAMEFIDDAFETSSAGNWIVIDTKDGTVNMNRHLEKQNILNPVTGQYILTEVEVVTSIAPEASNIVTSNGIIQGINSVLKVTIAKPTVVKAFFGGLPQDRIIRMPDKSVVTFIDVFNQWNNDPVNQNLVWWLKWGWQSGSAKKIAQNVYDVGPNGSVPGSINPLYKSDHPLDVMDGLQFSNPVGLWLELKTKPIFPGKYKVYIYEQHIRNNAAQTWSFLWSLDGERFPDTSDFTKQLDNFGNTITIYNSQKWDNLGGNVNNSYLYWPNYQGMNKILLGVVEFDKIATHKIKIEMVDEKRPIGVFKVQFEPVN